MRLGIFVDTTSLYRTVYRKFKGKLCYEEYYDQVSEDHSVEMAFAYGMRIGDTGGFISCLDSAGFTTKFKGPQIIEIHDVKIKKCDWGVGIAIDILDNIDRFDAVVIGSSDYNLLPLIKSIKERNREVWIIASLIPRALRETATKYVEIPEDWLEDEEEGE